MRERRATNAGCDQLLGGENFKDNDDGSGVDLEYFPKLDGNNT